MIGGKLGTEALRMPRFFPGASVDSRRQDYSPKLFHTRLGPDSGAVPSVALLRKRRPPPNPTPSKPELWKMGPGNEHSALRWVIINWGLTAWGGRRGPRAVRAQASSWLNKQGKS